MKISIWGNTATPEVKKIMYIGIGILAVMFIFIGIVALRASVQAFLFVAGVLFLGALLSSSLCYSAYYGENNDYMQIEDDKITICRHYFFVPVCRSISVNYIVSIEKIYWTSSKYAYEPTSFYIGKDTKHRSRFFVYVSDTSKEVLERELRLSIPD